MITAFLKKSNFFKKAGFNKKIRLEKLIPEEILPSAETIFYTIFQEYIFFISSRVSGS